jgi:hypothetical protein
VMGLYEPSNEALGRERDPEPVLTLWSRENSVFPTGNRTLAAQLVCRLKNSKKRPPLWSSGQSSSLRIQRPRVLFSAQPDSLRNSGSATGSTQHRE